MDAQPAGGLAEDRHVLRITAELGDVAVHPAKRGLLVHEPVVARGVITGFGGQRWMGEKSEYPEAIVDRDDDHALLDEPRRVVVVALSDCQPPAVDPAHDGKALRVTLSGASVRCRGV